MSSVPTSTLRHHSTLERGVEQPSSSSAAPRSEPRGAGVQRFDDDHITHIHCNDIDALAEQIRGWDLEFTQLSSGRFAATGIMLPLGSTLLGLTACNRSLLSHVQPPCECLSIVLPTRRSAPTFFRGKELTEGQCIVISPHADAEWITRGKSLGILLALSEDALRAIPRRNGDFLRSAEGARVLTPGPRWTATVLGAIDWILDAHRRNPEYTNSRSVRADWQDLMTCSLLNAVKNSAPRRNHRSELLHRHTAVERARAFVHDHLSSAISLADLCIHAHAQARSLEYGFREMLDMSPVSYIRAMRLNRAHHLLLSSKTLERTITEVALDCGFGHLSQFAMDYRKFFGESPSATLRSSRAAAIRPTHGCSSLDTACNLLDYRTCAYSGADSMVYFGLGASAPSRGMTSERRD